MQPLIVLAQPEDEESTINVGLLPSHSIAEVEPVSMDASLQLIQEIALQIDSGPHKKKALQLPAELDEISGKISAFSIQDPELMEPNDRTKFNLLKQKEEGALKGLQRVVIQTLSTNPKTFEHFTSLVSRAIPKSEEIFVEGIEGLAAKWFRIVTAPGLACAAAATAFGSCIAESEWAQGVLMATASGLIYVIGIYVVPIIPLPENWPLPPRITRTAIGAAVMSVGDYFGLWFTEMALRPGSTLSVVALRSTVSFVTAVAGTCTAVTLLKQPAKSWPTWVGMAVVGLVAPTQAVWAIHHPEEK